jgi:hypothetical protein
MRAAKVSTMITLAAAACLAQPWAVAQEPPRLEKLEEGEPPAVTIRGGAEAERQITETRDRGKVTSVKVKSGQSTYYLKPNEPAGSALPGDTQSNVNRGAQWQLMEFDLSRPRDPKDEAAQAAAAQQPLPPPAPPPVNSAAPAKGR